MTLFEFVFATARSSRPSPFRSAAAMPLGFVPAASATGAAKPPAPLPSSTEAVCAL